MKYYSWVLLLVAVCVLILSKFTKKPTQDEWPLGIG